MATLRVLYRDYDRAPYLYTVKRCAERYGLEIALEKAPLGGRFPEFLAEGATDVLAENYWGLQGLRAGGMPLVSVATAVTNLNEKLFVDPGVIKVADLAGKSVALRGVGPSALIGALWLKDHCDAARGVVVPEDEVGRWGNWKKVVSGDCAGAFVTNFYQDAPLAAGLKELAIEPYGFIGNVTLTTTEDIAARRRDEVQALVNAAFDASRLFKHDRAAALAIFANEPKALMEIRDDKEMARIYGILVGELSEFPLPSAEGISNTRRMRLARNPELAGFNPLVMWDLSFARAVLARVDKRPG
jgi:ABC-type nitrate/sulfonate/bicarbonate transport system substrate-binding protein